MNTSGERLLGLRLFAKRGTADSKGSTRRRIKRHASPVSQNRPKLVVSYKGFWLAREKPLRPRRRHGFREIKAKINSITHGQQANGCLASPRSDKRAAKNSCSCNCRIRRNMFKHTSKHPRETKQTHNHRAGNEASCTGLVRRQTHLQHKTKPPR